ncbi:MAG: hypothetical protein GX800_05265, partial [Clostridiaceae bacterium]|nr:hypothetical protein [Clostridiaceae bacterium]
MDILVKNNIIKKNKIIVDIGSKFTKVLEVNYKEPEKKEDEPVIDDVLPPLDDFFGELIP